MVKRRTGPIWVDQVRAFGMDTGFAASIHSLIRDGVDTVSNDPGAIEGIAKFLLAGRSETELGFRLVGKALVEGERGKSVTFTGYEWFTFKIPGGEYTPDFNYLFSDGHWVHIEVKGSKLQQGYKYSRSRLRAAASLNPWFDFYEAMKERGVGWRLERIPPDPEFVAALMNAI